MHRQHTKAERSGERSAFLLSGRWGPGAPGRVCQAAAVRDGKLNNAARVRRDIVLLVKNGDAGRCREEVVIVERVVHQFMIIGEKRAGNFFCLRVYGFQNIRLDTAGAGVQAFERCSVVGRKVSGLRAALCGAVRPAQILIGVDIQAQRRAAVVRQGVGVKNLENTDGKAEFNGFLVLLRRHFV